MTAYSEDTKGRRHITESAFCSSASALCLIWCCLSQAIYIILASGHTSAVCSLFGSAVWGRALCADWRTRSSCDPRGNCRLSERCMSPGTRIGEQTSCRGRGWGPGNRDFTPRWWSWYARGSAQWKWIVHVSRDDPLSTVVFSHASSPAGVGRHGTDVAEAMPVCFSPDRSAPGSSGQGPERRVYCW